MRKVVWIEADARVAAELPHRIVSAHEALEGLEKGQVFDALVIGATVAEPVRLARSLRAHADDVEILIVGTSERIDALVEAVRVDPLLGLHTQAVVTSEHLLQTVSQAALATAHRREHRRTMRTVQSTIDTAVFSVGQPSPLSYASAMWTESPVGALAVVQPSQHIASANRAATELLEHEELDLIGKRLNEVLPSRDDEGWSWLADFDAHHTERVVARKTSGGDELHLEARAVEVDAPGKDVVLVFLWDVTERVRLAQLQQDYLAAEMRAREHAEQASRAREEVLATVSHDLRSPLQTLLTSAEVLVSLAEHHQDSAVANVGKSVERAADYMTRLVSDLLDVARIEDGGLSLDYTWVDVDALVKQAVELTSGMATEQGVGVEACPVPESMSLRCDRTRVIQLLQNLLNNAIKFSPEGQSVTLDVARRDEVIRFAISDAGPGIPPGELPRLFDRFWQADHCDKKGLGLGLAIVRGIVDAHGGRVSVDSKPGEGATFRVNLPIET